MGVECGGDFIDKRRFPFVVLKQSLPTIQGQQGKWVRGVGLLGDSGRGGINGLLIKLSPVQGNQWTEDIIHWEIY